MPRSLTTAWLCLVLVAACGSKSKPADTSTPTPGSGSVTTGGATCTTDADCRIVADYCTACECRALLASAPNPTCDGPGVKCMVDPCAGKTAACEAGACVAKPAKAP